MTTNAETSFLSNRSEIATKYGEHKMSFWTKVKHYIRKDALMYFILLGIIVGFVVGFGIRNLNPSKDALMWLGMPGELFMRVLELLVLPLIICSVISGTSSLDPKSNGKISVTAFTYIVVTNTIASGLGVVLGVVFEPGVGATGVELSNTTGSMETQDIFADLLRNIMPNNIVEATFKQAQTQYSRKIIYVSRNTTNSTIINTLVEVTKSLGKVDSVNVLGLILICTTIGVAANSLKEEARVVLQFFSGFTEIVLTIMRKFFWFGPIGIGSLIAAVIARMTDITESFSQLGMFVLAVTVGMAIHSFVVLPAILFVITRRNPFKFILTLIRPLILGFAATSTAVTIPDMLNSCEEKNGIDKRVTRFVVPLCAAMNRDGSALYITCAAVFIGQMALGSVSVTNIVIIWILTSVVAMAIPPVPSASIVTLVIVLTSLGIPTSGVTLLFAVEWFLDRIRTDCNIISHTFSAAITYQFCKMDLEQIDNSENQPEQDAD